MARSDPEAMGLILHIAHEHEWRASLAAGSYRPASLATEGFIHCSSLAQTLATANGYFKGVQGLALLCIDEQALTSECRYEAPAGKLADERRHQRFPHIHGPLNTDAVILTLPFPCDDEGNFTLPAEVDPLARRLARPPRTARGT